jgi:mRNA interferase MazF
VGSQRRIRQGDVFWVNPGVPTGSSPGYLRPYVVIQNNLLNGSRISTVVTCALTTNLRRAGDPGNVLLEEAEANLPQASVVNVSQILTVSKFELRERIGALSPERVREVLRGIDLVLQPREVPGT